MAQTVLTTTETTLPEIPLEPRSRNVLRRELLSGYSLETAEKMASMPAAQLSRLIDRQLEQVTRELSRSECDAALRKLALLLPRAKLSPDDTADMLDLYHGLFVKYGMTARMLSEACERYVMAATADRKRDKFFPDPGELFELVRDDVRWRNKRRDALTRSAASLRDLVSEVQNCQPRTTPFRTAAEIIAEAKAKRDTPQHGDARALIDNLAEKMKA